MEPLSRHQCLVYQGAPSRHLSAMALVIQEKLRLNYRCLYLNSPPMVAGLRSTLAALGVDVAQETAKTSLMLSSTQQHLRGGYFDVDAMLRTLESGLQEALRDGYAGLWASGDMSWEFGFRKDFSRLLEYEWRLEEFFRTHPQLEGVCQYHADTLPSDTMRQGLAAHPALFISETLTLMNPSYIRPESFGSDAIEKPELASLLRLLYQLGESAG
jgi:hypothetical protein